MNGREEVIEFGVFYFDKKLVVVKFWLFNLEFLNSEINCVFVWIKMFGLEIKYWSVLSFGKIGS